ncbi:MAG: DUF4350 domain-containing protein [Candidatus Bathyarchaeota archaeon]|nr:DUF4350 domain-containing protein [Candidatus Bathyarchaeota archaeon]
MLPSKLLMLSTLLILLLASAIVWFYPPTGDFRLENPFWNGLQKYTQQAQATPLTSLTNLPADQKETALILIPYSPFTAAELAQIRNYVTEGGTLILLDDYGYGNQVLTSLDVNIKFTGQPLLDPLFNYQNKMLPKITDLATTPLSANVSSITFNHATALQVEDATIAAKSSIFSFLDTNDNQEHGESEPTGPFPMVAYTKLEQGYVVAVADPSLLINSMINLDGNLQFIHNAAALQTSNPKIYIDQTHLPTMPIYGAKTVLATIYGAAASPLGTILVFAALLTVTFYPMWKKVKKS